MKDGDNLIRNETSGGAEPPGKRVKLEAEEPPSISEAGDDANNRTEHLRPVKEENSSSKNELPGPLDRPKPDPESSDHAASLAPPPNSLPPQLLTLLQTIQSTLRSNFPRSPPHTAQRLAELVLCPKQHYRTLPSYLRALDRIVSVASATSDYPLPNIAPILSSSDTNNLFNGAASPDAEQEDKDFIGGAELTPIPWLRDVGSPGPGLHNGHTSDLRTESTSVIDGPNGAGSVETVTVTVNGIPSTMPASQAAEEGLHPGITQGELIRQEQEAGITPVPTGTANGRITRSSTAASAAAGRAAATNASLVDEIDMMQDTSSEEEETVHARGPSMIGMEDMGPQAPGSGLERGIDIEGPLGVRREGEAPESGVGSGDVDSEGGSSATLVGDANGAVEGGQAMDESGVGKGADAAAAHDTTAP